MEEKKWEWLDLTPSKEVQEMLDWFEKLNSELPKRLGIPNSRVAQSGERHSDKMEVDRS